MKSCILGLFFLGLTTLCNAQHEMAMVTSKLDHAPNMKSVSINADYLNSFKNHDVAKRAQKLQKIAANYNIKAQSVYTSSKSVTYTVDFNEALNHIQAIYDHTGKLVQSIEIYKNMRLPYALSKEVSTSYPGWAFEKIECHVNYTQGLEKIVEYHVELSNGKTSKTVTVTL
ncbi:hypothetical protein [Sediminibacter sp. Hel_I_10]|uniref:hypothetical protein n=1 Tax=Sediminibacter sp. Hel_I_10 TaxID=1392490 RepID=UPI00047CED93|nr:hypothetical protein [Sediminibacter sp. Hel_I_10]